jgi:hypothetical protein
MYFKVTTFPHKKPCLPNINITHEFCQSYDRLLVTEYQHNSLKQLSSLNSNKILNHYFWPGKSKFLLNSNLNCFLL